MQIDKRNQLDIKIGLKDLKLSLFADEISVCLENPNISIIKSFSEVFGLIKINIHYLPLYIQITRNNGREKNHSFNSNKED